MSDWSTPTYPPLPPTPPQPPPKKSRHVGRWVALAAAVLVFGGVGAAVATSNTDSKPAAHSTPAHSAATTAPAVEKACNGGFIPETDVCPDEDPAYVTPTKGDFRVTLKVTSRQCFGSAGCNISYSPRLHSSFVGDPDPSITYDVTYKVRGDESGPIIDTITVNGRDYQYYDGNASTAASGVKLTAKVVSVEAEG